MAADNQSSAPPELPPPPFPKTEEAHNDGNQSDKVSPPASKRRRVCFTDAATGATTSGVQEVVKHSGVSYLSSDWPVRILYDIQSFEDFTKLLDFYSLRLIELCGAKSTDQKASMLGHYVRQSFSSPYSPISNTAQEFSMHCIESNYARSYETAACNISSMYFGKQLDSATAKPKMNIIKNRTTGLNWIAGFLDTLHCSLGTFSVAVNMFDRFMHRFTTLKNHYHVSSDDMALTLVVIAELAIAWHEDTIGIVKTSMLKRFIKPTSGEMFTHEQWCQRQLDVLFTLNFNVHYYATPRALFVILKNAFKQGLPFYVPNMEPGVPPPPGFYEISPPVEQTLEQMFEPQNMLPLFNANLNTNKSVNTRAITAFTPQSSSIRFDFYCEFLLDLLCYDYKIMLSHTPAELVAAVGYLARWRWTTALVGQLISTKANGIVVPLPDDPMKLYAPWPPLLCSIFNKSERQILEIALKVATSLVFMYDHSNLFVVKQYSGDQYGRVGIIGIPSPNNLLKFTSEHQKQMHST